MMCTLAIVAAIWYVPGWLRTVTPQEGCVESLAGIYAPEPVAFKSWNGNTPLWPKAMANADAVAERFAAEVAAMPEAARTNLTVVGHSLGGRITVRVLARLAEKNLKIRQGVTLAAAIPHNDPDVAKMGGGSQLPVISICNPDDVVLRYVYAAAACEKNADYGVPAYGANGSLTNLANVIERVTPTDITETVKIDQPWGKSELLKEIANHHVLFYLDYLRRVREGEAPGNRIMVTQGRMTIEGKVMDVGVFWETLDTVECWRLERNVVTGHCRILDPDKTRRAWGCESDMRNALAKIKLQLQAPK